MNKCCYFYKKNMNLLSSTSDSRFLNVSIFMSFIFHHIIYDSRKRKGFFIIEFFNQIRSSAIFLHFMDSVFTLGFTFLVLVATLGAFVSVGRRHWLFWKWNPTSIHVRLGQGAHLRSRKEWDNVYRIRRSADEQMGEFMKMSFFKVLWKYLIIKEYFQKLKIQRLKPKVSFQKQNFHKIAGQN